MKLCRRILAILLCALLLIGSASAAGLSNFEKTTIYDGQFTDISGWYTSYVTAAFEAGLLNGTSLTTFSPDSTLRLREIVTVAARIHKLYNSGSTEFLPAGDSWYYPYYSYCIDQGLFTAAELPYESMSRVATRMQVVQILSSVLPASELPAVNTVEDGTIPDVPTTADGADVVYRFYRAGVLTGDSAHRFNGASSIKRSEMAAIVTRLTGLSPRSSVTMTLEALYKDRSDTVLVGGKAFTLGMSASDLTALLGEPDEIRPAFVGFKWQVYGTDTYENFLLAGIQDGTVVALYAAGPSFRYMGCGFGDIAPSTAPAWRVDSNADDTIYAVSLQSRIEQSADRSAYDHECHIVFHLVNAFRVCHGKSILQWSDAAAQCAEKHCIDMAKNNYFDHQSLDGRSPGDRLREAGIDWRGYGENIAAGYLDAIAVHHGWVNSAGHRSNMLADYHFYLGVGMTYEQHSYYRQYWGQNFFTY